MGYLPIQREKSRSNLLLTPGTLKQLSGLGVFGIVVQPVFQQSDELAVLFAEKVKLA